MRLPARLRSQAECAALSRRAAIVMSDQEVADFLASERVVLAATNGLSGWPHVMPLWYVLREGQIWAWTYAKSQKVRNLERDDRVTLTIESGERYEELRGVMVRARAVLHRDLDSVAELGATIFRRYGSESLGEGWREAVRVQAAKRVGLQFLPQRVLSWDHRKLGGVY